jgi:hypothetical protein
MAIARSILSVLGSYVLSVVLVMATDPLLHALFPNEYKAGQTIPDSLLWLSTFCFILISIACSWVCANLAPSRVRLHVLAFFALGEIVGLAFTVPNWGKVPHWYSIAWLIVWIPSVWTGWKLARRPVVDQ